MLDTNFRYLESSEETAELFQKNRTDVRSEL